jgi:2-oxo-4-hydroxy-4-carboxy-5-ureidoimidazoline decarboxylase
VRPDPDRLRACLSIERWVEEVGSHDYTSIDELVGYGFASASLLTEADVSEAIASHPRIGERMAGESAEARHSAAEQSASASDDAAQADLLARGNAAYEKRFGRVFIIRAAGRDRAEILAELDRRMANDDATELAETAAQLREIAVLRLRTTFAQDFTEEP